MLYYYIYIAYQRDTLDTDRTNTIAWIASKNFKAVHKDLRDVLTCYKELNTYEQEGYVEKQA